jgi:hypothetical protein
MNVATPTPAPLLVTSAPSPVPLHDPLWQQVTPLLLIGAGIALTIVLLIAAVLVASSRPSSDARDNVPRRVAPRGGPP